MFITGIATVAALLLIARAATRPGKNPAMMLLGLSVLALSLLGHVWVSAGWLSGITSVSAELGVGLMLGAGLMTRHKINARPWFFLGVISLTIGVVLFSIARFTEPERTRETTSYLLELGPDDSIEEVTSILDTYGATSERAFPAVTLLLDEDLAQEFLVDVPTRNAERLVAALAADTENVDMIEANRIIGLEEPTDVRSVEMSDGDVMENDPLVARQWGLEAIHGHEAHALLKNLKPVRKAKVSIVDTGVDGRHEDIRSTFVSSPGSSDAHGHGSHCAGIAGAATNNGVGIASLNWEGRFIEVKGYKALNDQGFGTVEMIAQAIIDASRDGTDVVSMSLGDRSPTPPKTIANAIRFALKSGAVVVVSAGNSNEDAKDHMPSNIDGVIVVSAVDEQLQKASFSNTNTSLKSPIAAPGVNILSLKSGGGYVEMSGTSMSTPMVSGLVGILRSINPDLSADSIYSILNRTGIDVDQSKSIGRLINAAEAIKAAQ